MAQYKKILSGYINDSKNGQGRYLAITNMSDEEIVLKPGDKLFLNETPAETLAKNPKIPHFSKSVKIEEEPEETAEKETSEVEDVADDIPF